MKNFVIAVLIIALVGVVVYFVSDGNFSLNSSSLLPVNYDKAGRDIAAMLGSEPSMTISEYQNTLKDIGMSSKDFITLLKNDPKESASMSQFIQFLSMDIAKDMINEYNIDVNNLKRALEK